MNNFKELFKKWWWVGLILLFIIGKIGKNTTGSNSSDQLKYSDDYYEWPCKICGRRLHKSEVLSPNQGIYTMENGYVFCSQNCWHTFQSISH